MEPTSQQHEWELVGQAPAKPVDSDYGYVAKGQPVSVTREQLIQAVQHNPAITHVWTPDTSEPVSPFKVPFLLKVFRENIRKRARNAILIGIALVLIAVAIAVVAHNWSLVYRNILFVFGGVVLTDGILEYARLRRYTAEDAAGDESAARFAGWIEKKPLSGYTFTLAGCIVVVAITQAFSNFSVETAGLVKPAVRNGQIWRLFTAMLMHAGFLHFWMNFMALLTLAKVVERTVQRACVPLVFLLTGTLGSVFSVFLYPNSTSVGASGGLMGLLGFITMAAYFDKTKYPPRYFRLMIQAIISVGLLGLFGFAFIDNAAHLGGLVGGLLLGWLGFRRNERWITENEKLVKLGGAAALLALLSTAAFAVYRLT
ncbi:MAG TPA: rhomboid family intramembrane serine protease [Pyrinomonadaceae bacterium]|nr:rhomboid family intramembrane serine protease [Pyrinomonadaceae bacterium]